MKIKIAAFVSLLVLVLVVQNIFAQGFEGPRMDKDNIKFRMHERLNLTDEQTGQIESLRLKHQKEMIDLKANVEKKKLELSELKLKGNYSREEYLNKYNEILSAKNHLKLSHANHQMDVYQLLDDNQKKEWNRMTNNFQEHRKHKFMRKMKNFDDN